MALGGVEVDGLVALFLFEVLVGLAPVELDLELALELAGVGALLRHDKGGGDALGAGAAGAADAVDEVVRGIGHVVVDDVRDVGDVDAAGGDVGGDQDAVLAVGEALEGGGALGLRAVAVDGVGVVAEALRAFCAMRSAPCLVREKTRKVPFSSVSIWLSRPSF